MRSNNSLLQWFSSCILATTWLSYYGYSYNVNIFNTHNINILAWSLWTANGYLFLLLFSQLKAWVSNTILVLITSWILYFIFLLFMEYIGYYILQIRENNGGNNDLIWGLIHGTPTLHVYYIFFPFIILAVYSSLEFYSVRIVKFPSKAK